MFPGIGKEVIARNMLQTLGSASAILASNMARLGMNVGFLGKLGQDYYGDMIISTLEKRNVDCSGIVVGDDVKTGITVSMTFPDDYAMVTYMGAMENFTLDEVNFGYVSSARHMHFSSFYLQPGMRSGCAKLFQKAKDMGLTTSFDPGWDPEEKWEADIFSILDSVDVFLPNESEALNITECHTVEDALETLSRHSSVVVIKQGVNGSILKSDDLVQKTKTYLVAAEDTTGAGDSFNAGFLSRWLKGNNLRECLIAGNACGAIATTKLGGATASPTDRELTEFLEKHNENIFDV